MRVIIAGSRGIEGVAADTAVEAAVRIFTGMFAAPTVVLSGTARGVDEAGERWAAVNGAQVERYPADWDRHGKRAGILRNVQMANEADGLAAIWDGQSRGTKHMIDSATARGLCVCIVTIESMDRPARGRV